MENHPLMLMVAGKNKELLRHPLSIALLRFILRIFYQKSWLETEISILIPISRRKWRMFGRMVFYLQFLHYIFFLLSVTAYVLLKLTFTNYQDQLKKADSKECPSANDQNAAALMGFRFAVFVTVAIAIVIEISELIRMKKR